MHVHPKTSYSVMSPLHEKDCSDMGYYLLKFDIQGFDMPCGMTDDVYVRIDVFEEESDNPQLVATTHSHFTVIDKQHLGPYLQHPDEEPASVFFRVPSCTAGVTAEFVVRVRGLVQGVRYMTLVIIQQGTHKMHVKEELIDLFEMDSGLDGQMSYSRDFVLAGGDCFWCVC